MTEPEAPVGAKLTLLAPQRTLDRGYAIVAAEDGEILRRPADIAPPQRLKLTLAGGSTLIDVAGKSAAKD